MSIETPPPPGEPAATSGPVASPVYTWLALLVAGLAGLGGFYLTLVEGKFACPLCFYQRSFALGVFAVLLIGVLSGMNPRVSLATLALPLAFAGLGVALWHVNLEGRGTLECPSGVFGIATAPRQSLVAFSVLCILLLLDAYQPGRLGNSLVHTTTAAVIGVALAAACGAPAVNQQPQRPISDSEYDAPPMVCRKPR